MRLVKTKRLKVKYTRSTTTTSRPTYSDRDTFRPPTKYRIYPRDLSFTFCKSQLYAYLLHTRAFNFTMYLTCIRKNSGNNLRTILISASWYSLNFRLCLSSRGMFGSLSPVLDCRSTLRQHQNLLAYRSNEGS